MISIPLFKQTLKENYKIFLAFIAILSMYICLITGMYNPNIGTQMNEIFELLPQGMLSAFGFSMENTTLTNFITSYLYGFLLIVFPLIYIIIISNRLIAQQVDRGSMAYLLATPNNRLKIVWTKALYLIVSIFVLDVYVMVLAIINAQIVFPGQLDINKFMITNVGALLLHFAISGIAFFASATFNDSKNSLLVGGGIPIVLYIINMLANMGGKLENLKYITIYSLFDANAIISGSSSVLPSFIILGVIGVVGVATGVIIFNKKDLSL